MIEWFYPSEIPTKKSSDHKIFSIEVLIFYPNEMSHAIGWYNSKEEKWEILSFEENKQDFVWRFFQDHLDKNNSKSSIHLWNSNNEIPDVVNNNNETESKNVLIYTPKQKYHAIGNFNYNSNEWKSIYHEQLPSEFYWRYLDFENDEI